MRLFHFTGESNWAAISLDREIITLLQKNQRYGKDGVYNQVLAASDRQMYETRPDLKHTNDIIDGVVWLTTNQHPRQQWMIGAFTNDPRDKGAIRIEVEVPTDLEHWPPYARRMKVDQGMRKTLNATGNHEERLWYLVPRPIPESEWLEVVRTTDGLVLWSRFASAGAGIPGMQRA